LRGGDYGPYGDELVFTFSMPKEIFQPQQITVQFMEKNL